MLLYILLILILVGIGTKLYLSYQVPSSLSHLKNASILSYIYSTLCGEDFDVRYTKHILPYMKDGVCRTFLGMQWELYISNGSKINEIFNHPEKFQKMKETDEDLGILAFQLMGKSNILFSNQEGWRRHRKLVNPSFKRAWDTQLFGKCTLELISILENSVDQSIIVNHLFQALTLDVLGLTLFNYHFKALLDTQTPGSAQVHLDSYHKVMSDLFNPVYFAFPALENFIPYRRNLHQRAQDLRQFFHSLVRQKRVVLNQGKGEGDDMVSAMLKTNLEEGVGISDEELVNNLLTFFIAGHDTTAHTLTSTMYFLAKYPEIQRKVRQEVYQVLNLEAGSALVIPSFELQKELKYTSAVLMETMRSITNVAIFRRYCPQPVQLEELKVPKGTFISIQSYGYHHDPKIFPNPELFDPDRFLNQNSTQTQSFKAFGAGSRSCLGKSMSLTEQRVVLSLIVQKFQFKLGHVYQNLPKPKLVGANLIHPIDLDLVFELL